MEIEGKILKIKMLIEKGFIVEAKILGDFFTSEIAKQLSEYLLNKKHVFEDISDILFEYNADILSGLIHIFF